VASQCHGVDAVRALVAAAAVALPAVVHAVPAVTCVPWLRVRCWSRLGGAGGAGTVALTFDDGPDPGSTPAFLDLLAGLRAPATFFVLGSMAAHAPDLLRRIRDEGHELAVHGWTHRNHLRLTPMRVYAELAQTAEFVERVAGARPIWFRPPYGVLSAGSCLAAARLGLRPLLWTACGRDWEATATPRSVVERLRSGGLRPGATVLLHDSDCTSAPGAWVSALEALPSVIEECRAQGARLVTVSGHLT
jgi:peptidoglycan/xylan/chitin deacetylase (PgdA/CDA1 family)